MQLMQHNSSICLMLHFVTKVTPTLSKVFMRTALLEITGFSCKTLMVNNTYVTRFEKSWLGGWEGWGGVVGPGIYQSNQAQLATSQVALLAPDNTTSSPMDPTQ